MIKFFDSFLCSSKLITKLFFAVLILVKNALRYILNYIISSFNDFVETAMGTSMKDDIESVANKYSKAIEVVGISVIERLCRIWLHKDFFFKLSNIAKVQEKALKDLHVFTSRIIRERRIFLKENNINAFDDTEDYGKKGRLAMLDLLLENEKNGNIDTAGIREEVDTFMFEV